MAKSSIVQHKHCVHCGKVCGPDKDTCSQDCEAEFNKKVRKKKMYYYIWLASVTVFLAIIVVSFGFGK